MIYSPKEGALGLPRKVLGWSAWFLLASVFVGFLLSSPAINHGLTQTMGSTAVDAIGGAFGIGTAVAGLCAWISAIVYALRSKARTALPKNLLVGLLLFGNMVSAFFFYFLYVLWLDKSTDYTNPSAVSRRST